MNEVRCPPADQPVTMIGPWMPCSPALVLSQSNALFSSLVICLRRERVAAQSRRPTASQRTLGEAGKDLLAAALPIAAVNVNEAWRLRIIGRIKVPFIAFSVSISQV